MMRNQTSVRFIKKRALLSMVLVLGFLTTMAAMPVKADEAVQEPSSKRFEIRFMKNMIDHHTMAVIMAELSTEKAVHNRLEEMSEDMVKAQGEEILKMQSWLKDWYDITYTPRLTSDEVKMIVRLARLDEDKFEIRFMKDMIEHHREAIQEAKACEDRADHNKLINLCEEMKETQRAEIRDMKDWLCEWYGICPTED